MPIGHVENFGGIRPPRVILNHSQDFGIIFFKDPHTGGRYATRYSRVVGEELGQNHSLGGLRFAQDS